jgi:hypothetical protein
LQRTNTFCFRELAIKHSELMLKTSQIAVFFNFDLTGAVMASDAFPFWIVLNKQDKAEYGHST